MRIFNAIDLWFKRWNTVKVGAILNRVLKIFLCSSLLIIFESCAAPSIYPSRLFSSDIVESDEIIYKISRLAIATGFVEEQPRDFDVGVSLRRQLFVLPNREKVSVAIDVLKKNHTIRIYESDSSVGGSEFPAESAAVFGSFERRLNQDFPGAFKRGIFPP